MTKSKSDQRTLADVLAALERREVRQAKARQKLAEEKAARKPGEGYEPCIVSFIDVLGFRDLLEKRHAHEVRDIMLLLRRVTTPDTSYVPRRKRDARLLSRSFADSVSDAVVRVRVYDTEYRDGAFFQEILDLLHVQLNCVNNGVVVRAGVTIGNAHVGRDGKGPVFGPAMVRAYEIEPKEAIYPRIVVDAAAYNAFLTDSRLRKDDHTVPEERAYVDGLLRTDADGKRFIDYLSAGETEFDDPAEYFCFLEDHAKLIRSNLNSEQGKVREKYEWLSRYHDDVVRNIIADFGRGTRSKQSFEDEYEINPLEFLRKLIVGI